jgi:DNA-binding transcriptional ArsR family regulator
VATYELVLDALGDPTRRAILTALRRGPSSVAGLTDHVPVSRPAISQHLKVLGQAGLVDHDIRGTRHIYRVDRDGLATLRDWLDQFWDDVLDAFADHVRRTESTAPTSSAGGRTAGVTGGRAAGSGNAQDVSGEGTKRRGS